LEGGNDVRKDEYPGGPKRALEYASLSSREPPPKSGAKIGTSGYQQNVKVQSFMMRDVTHRGSNSLFKPFDRS
jgi:hypothetical protein